MNGKNLSFIFQPHSIAVIGASARQGSLGRSILSNILFNGFAGVVYPVHVKARSILGVKAYSSVLHIPDQVDLAVLVVPAVTVPEVLAECGQKGVKGAVIITAGFKELGPNGAMLEKSLQKKAREYGISLIGPNCFGLINTDPRVRMNVTFGRIMPRPGNIAFVSQSGAIGVAALEYAEAENVGLSKFVSIGNKADINENHLLAYLGSDDETDVILLYLEDLVHPREFMKIARQIVSHPERPKPILAIKSGRTVEGAKAASSHTGALAGSDETYNAFFSQSRILRVQSLNELFQNAVALATQPVPKGTKVAILTNAGGVGIMATDACISNRLSMAALSPRLKKKLTEKMPPTVALNNPVDVIGDADKARYGTALQLLAEEKDVDGIIAIWTPTMMAETKEIAETIAEIGKTVSKPILGCLQTMGDNKEVRKALEEANIPHYRFPEDAARAMAAMTEFAYWSRRPQGEVAHFDDTDPEKVRSILEEVKSRSPRFLSEPEGHEILKAYGLPILDFRLVKSAEEALSAAETIGYPVVIKIVSPAILHKTDFGGVRINITNEEELGKAYSEMFSVIAEKKPDAQIWGTLVQKMAPKGMEIILGMKRDPQFGPLLMFGLGGILVEALQDVTFRVAPINNYSVEAMLSSIKAHKVLGSFRGKPPRDTKKIKECLQRLSQLVTDFEEFDEIDINPLLVYEEDKGAYVLDARFLLR